MKKAIAILLIAVLALTCFAACGKKDKDEEAAPASAVGVYAVKSMNGQSIEDAIMAEAGEELGDMSIDALLGILGVSSIDDLFSLEIREDGTFAMTAMGDTQEGTWTQDGSKVTLTSDGESGDATLNGSELTVAEEGAELVFVKK